MGQSEERAKPIPPSIKSRWYAPFQWAEWAMEWAVYWFKGIALFEFLEYAGKLTILLAVCTYFYEIPERRRRAADEKKRAQYEAWMIINSAKGEAGDGGRRLAIRDLYHDGVSLLGLTAEESALDGIDLSGADLRRAHLRWADLQNAKLSKSNLKNSNLRNVDLRNADLRGVSFVSADLRNAQFQGANLEGADLTEADVTGAVFQGAKGLEPDKLRLASHYAAAIFDPNFGQSEGFEPMNLGGLDLSTFDFRYAGLAGRDFKRAKLEACNFNGVDLSGANLNEADLSFASLRGANLSGAKLEKAVLTNVNQPLPPSLDPRQRPSSTVFPSSQGGPFGSPPSLTKQREGGKKVTNFRGANLKEANLMSANLEEADFASADLTAANFSYADLRGASFQNANLDRAKLEYCQNLTEDQVRQGINWERATYPVRLAVTLGLRKPGRAGAPSPGDAMAPSKLLPTADDGAGADVAPAAPAAPVPTGATPPPTSAISPAAPSINPS